MGFKFILWKYTHKLAQRLKWQLSNRFQILFTQNVNLCTICYLSIGGFSFLSNSFFFGWWFSLNIIDDCLVCFTVLFVRNTEVTKKMQRWFLFMGWNMHLFYFTIKMHTFACSYIFYQQSFLFQTMWMCDYGHLASVDV